MCVLFYESERLLERRVTSLFLLSVRSEGAEDRQLPDQVTQLYFAVFSVIISKNIANNKEV